MKQSQKIQQAKQQAKRMSERMNKMGFPLTPRQALELVAAERGFTTWNAYEAELRKPEPKTPRWNKKQGPMTQEQYLKHRETDNVCPVCGSNVIEGEYVEIDGKFAFQECACNDCESEWLDRYVAQAYILQRNGLDTTDGDCPVLKAYDVAAYDGGTFVSKSVAFGKTEDSAVETFRNSLGARRFSESLAVKAEFIAEVSANVAALVTWWTQNDADEEALDDMVYTAVQEHGLPVLNEELFPDTQEDRISDAEAHASEINNEGIEAQLKYLLSVWDPAALFTLLSGEIGLTGLPPVA